MIRRAASLAILAVIYGAVIVFAVRARLRTDANGNSES
jgi:hypothetical protein